MTRTQLINNNRQLFWYTPEGKKQDISDALLVERILNDGSLDDYKDLISVLGGKRVADVFFLRQRTPKGELLSRDIPLLLTFIVEVCTRRF